VTAPLVTFAGVARVYQGPPVVSALSPVDMTISAGDYVTVLGPSGAGKSTLLHLVGLLERPTAGRYELEGADVDALSDAQRAAIRARHIGFVFQGYHLLPALSALENVALAQLYTGRRPPQRRRLAAEALAAVGLGDRIHARPGELSGGECQQVAIARAVVNRPSLVLCDEPTARLHAATAASVLTLLDGIHADGFTLVLSTQDPEVAARGERRLTLRDGVLHE
jgi:putative ABC transport system ATP-binding protein